MKRLTALFTGFVVITNAIADDRAALMEDLFDLLSPEISEEQQEINDAQLLEILNAFEPIVAEAGKATVGITDGERLLALGTVVQAEGGIVTKASELIDGPMFCQFADGSRARAKVEKTALRHDLALLRIEQEGLPVAPLVREVALVGSLIATPSSRAQVSGVGVVSVGVRDLSGQGKGYLGVSMVKRGGRLVLESVGESTAAEAAGLQAGDVLLALDGVPYASMKAFSDTIAALPPEQDIEIRFRRRGETRTVTVSLGSREEAHELFNPLTAMDHMGGRTSARRTGFPQVWQHDIGLQPRQMGGPVVNLDGNVIGVNIARAGRVKTYAVPSSIVLDWLANSEDGENGKEAAPEGDRDDLAELLRELQEAEQSLKAAREKLEAKKKE